jgi:hypothetical protein
VFTQQLLGVLDLARAQERAKQIDAQAPAASAASANGQSSSPE